MVRYGRREETSRTTNGGKKEASNRKRAKYGTERHDIPRVLVIVPGKKTQSISGGGVVGPDRDTDTRNKLTSTYTCDKGTGTQTMMRKGRRNEGGRKGTEGIDKGKGF